MISGAGHFSTTNINTYSHRDPLQDLGPSRRVNQFTINYLCTQLTYGSSSFDAGTDRIS